MKHESYSDAKRKTRKSKDSLNKQKDKHPAADENPNPGDRN